MFIYNRQFSSSRQNPSYGSSNLGGWTTASLDSSISGKLYAFNSRHGGSTTAVYVPDAARATDPLNVLVWIHGDLSCGGEKGKNAIITYVRSKTIPLAKQVDDSKKPFVLVVPSMNWAGEHSHALGSPKTMNRFLEEVRTGLTAAGWSSTPSFGRLILAGHSRGYAVLNGLASRVADAESSKGALATLTDIWLIDTTYGKKHKQFHCSNWIKWADSKRGVKLHISYCKESPTSAVAECIRDEANSKKLTNIDFKGFPAGKTCHCDMPRNQMPNLLAGKSSSSGVTSSPSASTPSIQLSLPVRMALLGGQWNLAMRLTGDRDPNRLTNMIFFARHPELNGRKLVQTQPNYQVLSQDWLNIRRTIVGPFLNAAAKPVSQSPQSVAGGRPYPEVNELLPASGPGFKRRTEAKSYGLPETIRAIEQIAEAWHAAHPNGPRIVIHDISRQGGGKLPPHKSHQVGLDMDIVLEGGKASWQTKKGPKVNNRYTWVQNPTYSRSLTADLIKLIVNHPKGGLKLKFILFDDPQLWPVSKKVVMDKSSPHRDHLHVRFCAPSYFAAKVGKMFESCS